MTHSCCIATINQSRCVERWHHITSIRLMISERKKQYGPFVVSTAPTVLQTIVLLWISFLNQMSHSLLYWTWCTHSIVLLLCYFKCINPHRLDLIAKMLFDSFTREVYAINVICTWANTIPLVFYWHNFLDKMCVCVCEIAISIGIFPFYILSSWFPIERE